MKTMQIPENKWHKLPSADQYRVVALIEQLYTQHCVGTTSAPPRPTFAWAGALSELNPLPSSVDLQHNILALR